MNSNFVFYWLKILGKLEFSKHDFTSLLQYAAWIFLKIDLSQLQICSKVDSRAAFLRQVV